MFMAQLAPDPFLCPAGDRASFITSSETGLLTCTKEFAFKFKAFYKFDKVLDEQHSFSLT